MGGSQKLALGEFGDVEKEAGPTTIRVLKKLRAAVESLGGVADRVYDRAERRVITDGGRHSQLSELDYDHAGHTGFVPDRRVLTAVSGLFGGGDMSADRLFGIDYAAAHAYHPSGNWTSIAISGAVGQSADLFAVTGSGLGSEFDYMSRLALLWPLAVSGATLTIGPHVYTSGQSNTANYVHFGDDTAILQDSTGNGIPLNETLTIEALFRVPSGVSIGSQQLQLVTRGSDPTTNAPCNYQLGLRTTGKPYYRIHKALTGTLDFTGTHDLRDGGWHHLIAVVEKAATPRAWLYVDGIFEASGVANASDWNWTLVDDTTPTRFGNNLNGNGTPSGLDLAGVLARHGMAYSGTDMSAVTPTNRAALGSLLPSGNYSADASIIFYVPFWEQTGQIAHDIGPSGYQFYLGASAATESTDPTWATATVGAGTTTVTDPLVVLLSGNGQVLDWVLGNGYVGLGIFPAQMLHVSGNGLFTGWVSGTTLYGSVISGGQIAEGGTPLIQKYALSGAYALETRQIIAGSGLIGGGTLAADRTVHIGIGSGLYLQPDIVGFDTSFGDARYALSGATGGGGGGGSVTVTSGMLQTRVLLYDNAMSSDTAGPITVNPVGAGYDRWEILLQVASTCSSNVACANIKMEFNSDTTGANYQRVRDILGTDTGDSRVKDTTGGYNTIGQLTTSNASSSSALTPYQVMLYNPDSSTKGKPYSVNSITPYQDTNSMYGNWAMAYYQSNTAITRIDFSLTAGNFKAGSRIQIWGIKNQSVVTGVMGGGVTPAFSGLTDVNNGSWTSGQMARYDGATWQPFSQTSGQIVTDTEISGGTLGASQSSIDIQSIPAGYDDLILRLYVRTDRASENDGLSVYFNGDSTGSNYRNDLIVDDGANPTFGVADDFQIGLAPGGNAPANTFGWSEVTIGNYAGSAHKTMQGMTGRRKNATAVAIALAHVVWENTAAVNRITVITGTGSNIVAGTKYQLVARKKDWFLRP